MVEFIREERDIRLTEDGTFHGPHVGGAPVNFAAAMARLGVEVSFLGGIGEDEFGKYVLERLGKAGLKTNWVMPVARYTTGMGFITYLSDETKHFVYHLQRSAAGQPAIENFDLDEVVRGVEYFFISGSSFLHKNIYELIVELARRVKAQDGKIVFDPNYREELLSPATFRRQCEPILAMTDILLPSGNEPQLLMDNPSAERACRELIASRVMKFVILKQGAEGAVIYREGAKDVVRAEPMPREHIADTTGVGEVFDAAFLYAYLGGLTLHESVEFANLTAAISLTKKGGVNSAVNFEDIEGYKKNESRLGMLAQQLAPRGGEDDEFVEEDDEPDFDPEEAEEEEEDDDKPKKKKTAAKAKAKKK